MNTSDPHLLSLHSALALAGAALAGRLLTACLPADTQDRRMLPVTWAASLYLGWAALALELDLASRAGLAHRHVLLALPWLGLLALRTLTLPGAMAPRHAPREAPRSRIQVAVGLALVAWIVFLGTRRGTPVGDDAQRWLPTPSGTPRALHLGAMAAFLLHGLRVARRLPLGRLLLTFALLATPALTTAQGHASDRTLAAAVLVGGSAFALAWLRRANRRARALAVLAFTLLPLSGAPAAQALGVASLAALVAATPAPSRRDTAVLAGLGLGFHALTWWLGGCPAAPELLAPSWPKLVHGWWALAFLGPLLALRRGAREPSGTENGAPSPVDPPRREHAFVVLQLAACATAALLDGGLAFVHLVMLCPLAALSCGLALPGEPGRPGGTVSRTGRSSST